MAGRDGSPPLGLVLQSVCPKDEGVGLIVLTFGPLWSHTGQHRPRLPLGLPQCSEKVYLAGDGWAIPLPAPRPPWSLTSKEQGARTGLGLWERKVCMEEVRHQDWAQTPGEQGFESIWAVLPGGQAAGQRTWPRRKRPAPALGIPGLMGKQDTRSTFTSANDPASCIPL